MNTSKAEGQLDERLTVAGLRLDLLDQTMLDAHDLSRYGGLLEAKERRRLAHAIAFHEAGHAVVAWQSRLKIKYVTVIPDGELLGTIKFAVPTWFQPRLVGKRLRDRHYLERWIVALQAGGKAERWFRDWISSDWTLSVDPFFWKDSTPVGDEIDVRIMEDLLRHVPRNALPSNFMEASRQRVETLLVAYWPLVESVAAALLERKTLTGTETVEVIQASMPPTKFGNGESNSSKGKRKGHGGELLSNWHALSLEPVTRAYAAKWPHWAKRCCASSFSAPIQ